MSVHTSVCGGGRCAVGPAKWPILVTICRAEPKHLSETAAAGRSEVRRGSGPTPAADRRERGLSPRKRQLLTLKPVPVRRGCDGTRAAPHFLEWAGQKEHQCPFSPAPAVTVACHRAERKMHSGFLSGRENFWGRLSPGAVSARLPREGLCLSACEGEP